MDVFKAFLITAFLVGGTTLTAQAAPREAVMPDGGVWILDGKVLARTSPAIEARLDIQ